MATSPHIYLHIYLRDQHAMGVAWRELARRARRNNGGSALGTALALVAEEIAADVRTFEGLMASAGTRPDRIKTTAVTAAERLARLKPNGKVRSYSPLSRFEELDALVMGIEGKMTLWATLRDSTPLPALAPQADFDALIRRAEEQRATLAPFHAECARAALAGVR